MPKRKAKLVTCHLCGGTLEPCAACGGGGIFEVNRHGVVFQLFLVPVTDKDVIDYARKAKPARAYGSNSLIESGIREAFARVSRANARNI